MKSTSIIAALTLADTEIPNPEKKEALKAAACKAADSGLLKTDQQVENPNGLIAISTSLSSSTSNVAASGSPESSDTEVP